MLSTPRSRARRRILRWLPLSVVFALVGCGSVIPPAPFASGGTAATPSSPTASTAPSESSVPSQPPVAPVQWTDCGKGFQCGSILAPLDYANPSSGGLVRIALIRLPATDQAKRIGSLIVNPGGPGASGIDFVKDGATSLFSKAVRARFDIVGFDPRGVNDSSPIRCVDDLDHVLAADRTPDNSAEKKELLSITQDFVAGCKRRNAAELPFVGTESVARDLDQIRQAVGDDKLTYLGFSYGTLIGALYAGLFPNRIRAMTLDGAIDPKLDLFALRTGQATGFETELDRFLADCARRTSCYFHNGGRTGPAFDAVMRQIEQAPLPSIRIIDRRLVGPTYAWSAVLGSLYNKDSWPALAAALALAQQGDGALLLLLADPFNGRQPRGGYSNLIDAYTAVTCLDWPGPRNVASYVALAATLAKKAPRIGAFIGYNDIDCAYWPVAPDRTPAPVRAPGAPPIVVVGSSGDPATPFTWAVALAKELESGVLVKRVGDGHTGYGISKCVTNAVDSYLLSLKVPKSGLTCH